MGESKKKGKAQRTQQERRRNLGFGRMIVGCGERITWMGGGLILVMGSRSLSLFLSGGELACCLLSFLCCFREGRKEEEE